MILFRVPTLLFFSAGRFSFPFAGHVAPRPLTDTHAPAVHCATLHCTTLARLRAHARIHARAPGRPGRPTTNDATRGPPAWLMTGRLLMSCVVMTTPHNHEQEPPRGERARSGRDRQRQRRCAHTTAVTPTETKRPYAPKRAETTKSRGMNDSRPWPMPRVAKARRAVVGRVHKTPPNHLPGISLSTPNPQYHASLRVMERP